MTTATRTRAAILGELRALVTLQQQCRTELGQVQRHEMQLVTGIDARARMIDRILDELIDAEATC